MREPPTEELARVIAGEANQAERLRRCGAERDALPEATVTAEPKPPDPAHRLEAVLVEQRIEQLARRDVHEARLEPTNPIYSALGPYPHGDPDKALAWGGAPMRSPSTGAATASPSDPMPSAASRGTPPREPSEPECSVASPRRSGGWVAPRSATPVAPR